MVPSIVNNTVQGETLLPGQIFVFGGFALRANSLGHLEQIDSYAPGHQVIFGNLNYTTDIRGDLIFEVFEAVLGVPDSHDKHGLDLLSDEARDITPAVASDLNPEQVALPKDEGWTPPRRPHTHRRCSRTQVSPLWSPATPDPRTRIRLLAPVRAPSSQPSQARLRSWNLPLRTSSSTRPLATC